MVHRAPTRLDRSSRLRPLALTTLLAGSIALLGVAGCGEDQGPSAPVPGASGPVGEKADGPGFDPSPNTPTITFGADGVVSQSGSLVAGGQVRVVYALERVDECRAQSGGYPQWGVTGWYSADGGAAQSFQVAQSAGPDLLPRAALLTVPEGRDLAFWFEATSRYGCHTYDSADGANFHFTIGAAGGGGADALLTFGQDGSPDLQGTLVAGGTLRVRYDLDRLPGCRGTQGGIPQWSITGSYSVDGGEAHAFDVSQVSGDDRVSTDAVLTVPQGQSMAFWFYVSNRWGCIAYDSDYGNNYVFPIAAP
jgi:hypothetical protein